MASSRRQGKDLLVRHAKPILIVGTLCALLTAYIYFHASFETFVIYVMALALWAGLWGYCARMRTNGPKRPKTGPGGTASGHA
jgi:hypothetical protein